MNGKKQPSKKPKPSKVQEPEKRSEPFLATQAAVAKALRVSIRTVANWIGDGMPVRADGKYDLSEILAWKEERDGTKKGDKAKRDYDTEIQKYKALKEKLNYEERLGQLVPIDEVKTTAFSMARKLRDNFLMLPDRVSPILAAESDQGKVRTLLLKEIREILKGVGE